MLSARTDERDGVRRLVAAFGRRLVAVEHRDAASFEEIGRWTRPRWPTTRPTAKRRQVDKSPHSRSRSRSTNGLEVNLRIGSKAEPPVPPRTWWGRRRQLSR